MATDHIDLEALSYPPDGYLLDEPPNHPSYLPTKLTIIYLEFSLLMNVIKEDGMSSLQYR